MSSNSITIHARIKLYTHTHTSCDLLYNFVIYVPTYSSVKVAVNLQH